MFLQHSPHPELPCVPRTCRLRGRCLEGEGHRCRGLGEGDESGVEGQGYALLAGSFLRQHLQLQLHFTSPWNHPETPNSISMVIWKCATSRYSHHYCHIHCTYIAVCGGTYMPAQTVCLSSLTDCSCLLPAVLDRQRVDVWQFARHTANVVAVV